MARLPRPSPCKALITLAVAFLLLTGLHVHAVEPPVIPVGLDAYRMWDRWPYQRIGVRAYMRSTYDRTGGNRTADASHFLYQESDDFNVTLDVLGPGVLYFVRYNHWHGSPWHYEVDGTDHIVKESSTANPNEPVQNSTFIPRELFPEPLAWTWSTTKGADLNWVPVPFEESFRMAYSRTHYGTGYYIYHKYMPGARLSQPVRSWRGESPPDRDLLELIRRSGTDIAPKPDMPEGDALGIKEVTGEVDLDPGENEVLTELNEAPSTVRALKFSAPRQTAVQFGKSRIRITWDGREHPSVDAPLALFFGTGSLYNRNDQEYLVKAFPMNVRFDDERVHLACYLPMPFFRSARFELTGPPGARVPDVRWSVRCMPCEAPPEHLGYFHATYRDHPHPPPGRDLVLLDTENVEGGGDWSGNFIGTSLIFTHSATLTTLEGDPRFFFDDSLTPQAQGTGTEEWGGGGDYWGGRTMTLPFAGHPVGARRRQEAHNQEDLIHSEYRYLLADLMPFGKRALIRLEHGPHNESREHYETVAYWYGLPAPSLVKTDVLDVGDQQSEEAHDYHSPDASDPEELTSRYEWGVSEVQITGPQPDPRSYAEFTFEAEAGQRYYIWVRGKSEGDLFSDATWFQFDDEIGTARLGPGHDHEKGFGNWLDRFPKGEYAWSSGLPQDPPQWIEFQESGRHRLRVQARHATHYIDQIWLSPSQKKLPDFTEPISGEGADIVLEAGEAELHGNFRRVTDPDASSRTALEVNEATERTVQTMPTWTDTGRHTKRFSEFTLNLRPDNHGVLLRRRLDYSYPNQRADVYVADAGGETEWRKAGVWYLAGSNTCVYSYPRGELGETQHRVIESDRRWRDDEFLLPKRLTRGKERIRLRVEFRPIKRPLFPGHPLPELAWSEFRYTGYCYVTPEFEPN